MNYIPNTPETRQQMLEEAGFKTMDELFSDIPENLQFKGELGLPSGFSEMGLNRKMKALADKNRLPEISFLGAGCYSHYIPAAVAEILSRSEFYTAYTPYQPEISQGILQAIFEYQTMICRLTKMDAANASVYDGSTAVAEAALMSSRITGKKEILISKALHPEYREVLRTYCDARNLSMKTIELDEGKTSLDSLKKLISANTAGVIIQSPNFFGKIEDLEALEPEIHANKAIFTVCISEPVSLGLLKAPGDYNADIVAGEGQAFGNAVNFGGPHLGIMACKKNYMRKLPGRIVGLTKDTEGKPGFVLTLQAREQHIRRDSANSNICSNQALCALAATVYLATLGKSGLKQAAELSYQKAHYAQEQLLTLPGFEPVFAGHFFNEFVIKTPDAKEVTQKLLDNGIMGGLRLEPFYPELKNSLLFCVTEMNTKEDIDRMIEVLK